MKFSKIYLSLFAFSPVLSLAQVPQMLDEIQVVGQRDISQYVRYNHNATTLNKDNLSKWQASSVAESLSKLSNVDIGGGSRALAQKPIIRGLGGNRVVQVIDGVRQNFDLAHRGSYFLPPSQVQEIEVIKGASSTLWGSGALGGVVAVRTPNALDLLRDGDSFGALVRQGYQSANNQSETDLSVFGATEKFDYLLQGFYNDSDNLRIGKGEKLPSSALNQRGLSAKLGWQINDSHRAELSHRTTQSKQTAPSNNEMRDEYTIEAFMPVATACHRSGNCNIGELYSGLGGISYLSAQKVVNHSTALNYYLNPSDNPYLNTQFTVYRNQVTEKETRLANELIKDRTDLKTYGFNLKNSSNLAGLSLTYGVDYYQDRAEVTRGKTATEVHRPDDYTAKADVVGVYLLGHLPVLNEKLIISPSLRYDRYANKGDTKQTESEWSPALALTWKATNWLDLTARYNQAFRAPSLQEKYSSGTHFGFGSGMRALNSVFVANPDLKPEKAQNKEISANFHWDNFVFNATYFQNDVKDFIELHTYSSGRYAALARFMPGIDSFVDSSQYRNVADARLRGFELDAQYKLGALILASNYGQTHGKDKATGEALENIVANKLGFAVDYEVVKDKFNLGARVTRYWAQHRVSADHQTYAGYTLTDLTATFAPKAGEWKNIRLDLALENLFDKKYQPAFSLMEGSGRNVKANVSYYF
ncbi:ligand-gated channel [Pasteurellaceae bacterium RH1A]|nr:ligand-gated channel [Pasteurellaceae bacterium RH1A]